MIDEFKEHLDSFTVQSDNELINMQHYLDMAIDYAELIGEDAQTYINYAIDWYIDKKSTTKGSQR